MARILLLLGCCTNDCRCSGARDLVWASCARALVQRRSWRAREMVQDRWCERELAERAGARESWCGEEADVERAGARKELVRRKSWCEGRAGANESWCESKLGGDRAGAGEPHVRLAAAESPYHIIIIF